LNVTGFLGFKALLNVFKPEADIQAGVAIVPGDRDEAGPHLGFDDQRVIALGGAFSRADLTELLRGADVLNEVVLLIALERCK